MAEGLPQRPIELEPLALDLVNTEWVDGGGRQDLLALSGGLEHWLAHHHIQPERDREKAVDALRETRVALRRSLDSDDGEPDARAALNAVLDHGHVIPRILAAGANEEIRVDPGWHAAWLAARDYVNLRLRWPRWRVRACRRSGCILYFLDTTRNGTRRWCNMRTCGNRAKARRYHQRHHPG